MRSTNRRVGAARLMARVQLDNLCPEEPIQGRIEIDSHADTCVLGKNFIVLDYTGRECDVVPYTEDYERKSGVPIVSGGTAWTDQSTSETFILVIHEGLYMPDAMPDTLLNPNQLRHFGAIVQDNPYAGAPLYITDSNNEVEIPLRSEGTVIFADTRTPTEQELSECRKVVLTSNREWDPQNIVFPNAQWSITEDKATRLGSVKVSAARSDIVWGEPEFEEIYNDDAFCERVISSVKVASIPPDTKSTATASVAAVEMKGPPTPHTFVSEDRKSNVTPQALAEKWLIGLEQAALTLKNTTQWIVRSALLPLARRYKADRVFTLPQLQGEWFTDTVDGGKVKSINGNKYGQIFANEKYFAAIYPMDKKSKAGDALRVFCKEFGVPDRLRYDGSKEQTGRKTEFQKQVRRHDIKTHAIEPDLHNQSPAEGVVREVRRKWYRVMVKKNVPRKFWDYGMRWVCEIMQRTHLRGARVDGGVPLQAVTGETVEISEYLDFGFYDRIWYRDNAGLGPQQLGRWLGVAKHQGAQMCFYVLTPKGTVVSRSTVWPVTNLELETEVVKSQVAEYDASMKRVLGDGAELPLDGQKPDPEQWADLLESDEDFREEFFKVYEDSNIPEADKYTPEIGDDSYLNMELALPRDGDGLTYDGKPIGVANENLILDTRMFEVKFLDGHTAAMSSNAIAESMFSQVDQEGNRLLLLDEIIDYRLTGTAVKPEDAFVEHNGRKYRKKTTVGAELLMRWKDGSETWTALKDAKEAFPVQLAEYAVTNKLEKTPQFAWWVPHVIKKRAAIVKKVKSKYWDRTTKFGIKIPKTVQEAKRYDQENGNTLWWDAICQEMANVRIAFEEAESAPIGHSKINVHLIFDVKLGENYRRKARLVAGGHVLDAPSSATYSSVVSRDSVRIALLVAALNGLDILACDIQNAYLTAPAREKVYIIAGDEFGSDKGKIFKVVRALYGLKSAGASFRAFLAEHL